MKGNPFKQNEEQKEEEGHPSGASAAQVAAYKKAGMKWYADRKKWMYPEGPGLPYRIKKKDRYKDINPLRQ